MTRGRVYPARRVTIAAAVVALLPFFAGAQPAAGAGNVCAWEFLDPAEGSGLCNGQPCLTVLEATRTLKENLEHVCTELVVEDLPTDFLDGCVLEAASGALVCGAGGGAPLTVEEGDGTPTVGSIETVVFAAPCTVTDDTGGQVTVDCPGSAGAGLTVEEEDGTPSVAAVTEIRVANGALTDNGLGSVSLAGGGGSPPNSFETINTTAGTDPVADSATDTLILAGTAPLAVTGDAATDTVTLSVADATTGARGVVQLAEDLAGTAAAPVVVNDSHDHTGASVSALDAADITTGTFDPARLPTATTAAQGAVVLAGDGEATAGEVVEATDDRLTDSRDAVSLRGVDLGADVAAPDDGDLVKFDQASGEWRAAPAGSAAFVDLDSDYGDETVTSTWNLGGAIVEVPNSTAPTAGDCDDAAEHGRVHVDSDAPSGEQFYVCEGAAGWVLQGGGGGDSPFSGVYHPDRAPTSGLSTPSDELNGAVPSCTWGNQGSSTWTASMDTAVLDIVAGDATEQARVCYLGAPPAGNWTMVAKLSLSVATGTGNLRYGILGLIGGTTASPTSLATSLCGWFTANKEFSCGANSYTSYAYAGGVNHGVQNLWETSSSAVGPPAVCLRLQHDDAANTLASAIAWDCMTWQTVGTQASVTTAPSNLGLFVSATSAVTVAPKLRIEWVRTFASLTDVVGEE